MIFSDTAFKLYKHGLIPIPTAGKRPVITNWTDTKQFDDEFIYDLIEKYPSHNIGILTGNGLCAVDVDYDGERRIDYYAMIKNLLPNIACEKIGRKGFTIFLRGDVKSYKKRIGDTLMFEILSEGKQTILPPSVHPETKKPYLWADKSILDFDLDELPELTQEIVDSLSFATDEFFSEKKVGARNAALWGYAYQSAKDALSFESWRNGIVEYDRKKFSNDSWFNDPKERGSRTVDEFIDYMCKSWFRSVRVLYKKHYNVDFSFGLPSTTNDDLPPDGFYVLVESEDRNGVRKPRYVPDYRFAGEFCRDKNNMVFSDSFSYIYKDNRWVTLEKNSLNHFICESSRQHWQPYHFDNFAKSIRSLCNFQSKEWLPTDGLINLKNGILNVATGELLKHSNRYFFKGIIPIEYDPEAKCPRFYEFLDEILNADAELIELVMEMFGYVLMGGRPFLHKAFVLYGDGRNGKSTLLDVLKAIVGKENYSSVPMSMIDRPFSAILLDGKLANIVGESPGEGINAEAFKGLVAGEPIVAAFKGKDEFTITPQVRLIFACNNLPTFGDNTYSIRERLIMIPFERTFSSDDVDVFLIDKLIAELPGILNFALAGVGKVTGLGRLSEPKKSQDLKLEFMEETDSVYSFFTDCVTKSDNELAFVSVNDAYLAYQGYCEATNRRPFSMQKFSKGIVKFLDSNRCRSRQENQRIRGYRGVSITNPYKTKRENDLDKRSFGFQY